MQKYRILSPVEEKDRALRTLEKGLCFISNESLHDKDYELVWHAGADSYVYVEQSYLNQELQKESQEAINIKLTV